MISKLYAWLAAAVLISALVSLVGCGETAHDAKHGKQVILITLDTTRADHLGVYGAKRVKTPNIDSFAQDAVVFTNCFSAANSTHAAHASLFTSLYVKDHGVDDNYDTLPDNPRIISRVFRKMGYRTASFVSVCYLGAGSGFDQGFDEVYGLPELKSGTSYTYKTAEQNNSDIFRWLDKHHDEDFFIWLHYFDPHAPYTAPAPYNTMYKGESDERISDPRVLHSIRTLSAWLEPYLNDSDDPEYYRNMYKGEISYLDRCLGDIMNRLKDIGIYHDSVIVLLADHGEALGEEGIYFEHDYTLDDSTTRVPLIMKLSGEPYKGKRRQLVSSVDVYPTLIELSGIDVEHPIRGESLAGILRSHDAEEVRDEVYSQGYAGAQAAVRTRE